MARMNWDRARHSGRAFEVAFPTVPRWTAPPKRKAPRADDRWTSEPPVTTEPDDRVMLLRIECQCGHVGEVTGRPARLIGRRLRCSACGEDPRPF